MFPIKNLKQIISFWNICCQKQGAAFVRLNSPVPDSLALQIHKLKLKWHTPPFRQTNLNLIIGGIWRQLQHLRGI